MARMTAAVLILAAIVSAAITNAEQMDEPIGPYESRLRQELMMNYDKSIRPGAFSADKPTTTVFLDPHLLHVDACDRAMTATLGGWVMMSWHDPRLAWEPIDYGNITQLRVDSPYLWTLDLMPFYMVPSININWISNTLALVMNNGTVIYVPPFQTKVSCTYNDTTTGPDEDNWNAHMMCPMSLGSWAYSEEHIDLMVPESGALNTMYYRPSARWILHNTSAKRVSKKYIGYPELYVTDEITVNLKRKRNMYMQFDRQM